MLLVTTTYNCKNIAASKFQQPNSSKVINKRNAKNRTANVEHKGQTTDRVYQSNTYRASGSEEVPAVTGAEGVHAPHFLPVNQVLSESVAN